MVSTVILATGRAVGAHLILWQFFPWHESPVWKADNTYFAGIARECFPLGASEVRKQKYESRQGEYNAANDKEPVLACC